MIDRQEIQQKFNAEGKAAQKKKMAKVL